MRIDSIALPFKGIADMTTSIQDLIDAMVNMTMRLGLEHFAIANHVDVARTPGAILLHNYPPGWAEHYEKKEMFYIDPVHRRSHLTTQGFAWSDMDRLDPMNPSNGTSSRWAVNTASARALQSRPIFPASRAHAPSSTPRASPSRPQFKCLPNMPGRRPSAPPAGSGQAGPKGVSTCAHP